jgi:hypothetical protein
MNPLMKMKMLKTQEVKKPNEIILLPTTVISQINNDDG